MWKKGSYTIEATLLMVVIIPVLVGIMYLGFYLHDKAVLNGAALETAKYASLHITDEDVKQQTHRQRTMLIKGRLLGTRQLTGRTVVDKNQVEVVYQGQFLVPGLIVKYFYNGSLPIDTQITASVKSPVKTIQKIRGVKKLFDKQKEGED